MKVLVVADTHGKLTQKQLSIVEKPDLIVLLGDVSYVDIETILDIEKLKGIEILGVVGNHDSADLLSNFERITDLHMKTVTVQGVTFGGYGGSIRYKEDDYYMMHTNEESIQELSKLGKCDVLITHDKPCFAEKVTRKIKIEKKEEKKSFFSNILDTFFKKDNYEIEEEFTEIEEEIAIVEHSHSGLVGIAKYIESNNPRYVLHGHIHDISETMHGNTKICCFYNVNCIEL